MGRSPGVTGIVLVIGGTRSGKSSFAESLLDGTGGVAYLATASATDPEMVGRIAAHRHRRPATWTTVEVGDDPVAALDAAGERAVLLDGLGAWIAGALHRGGVFDGQAGRLDAVVDEIRGHLRRLAERAAGRSAPTVVVVEDAGSAPVAVDRPTRRWVDLTGEAAQGLSAVASRAFHVVAGRAVELPATGAGEPASVAPARPLHGDRMVPPGSEDFAVNVVGGGPPEWLRARLREALDGEAARYPDACAAVAAVAARHERASADVLALSGAAEGFWLLAAALRPRRPVIVAPAFTEAGAALRAHGAPPASIGREAADGFALHAGDVPSDADLVVVTNPCNPTGVLHAAGTVLQLARPGRTLVVDEAFMDLVPGEEQSVAWRGRLPGVVVLRSLTKSLGIPGVRAGYLLAEPDVVERLAAHRQPWAVNGIALAALVAWAERDAPTGAVAQRVAADRDALAAALAGLPGVTVHPGAANFLLLRVPEGERVLAALHVRRVTVRPTTDLGLDSDHLRVTVRESEANERLVAALAGALAEARGTP